MCHKFGKQLAHNSWSPHAHQLLCMRISAVMQAHNSCCATGDTNCLNNIFYLFQQHILSLPTTYPISFNKKKRMYHQLMIHPLFRYSLYLLLRLLRRKPVEPTGKVIQHLVVIWETMGSISESPSMSGSRIDVHGTLVARLAHS